ncbi:MAG: RNA methyltransferase TrmH family [Anaerolineaceae bacterium]|nr:MAG: RNA methyltransferase TrmH family [Anaerolineaceae bacterium]
MIISAQNPKLKLVRALMGRPKERRAAGAFAAEGVRLVEEALAAGWPFRFVLAGETLSERGRELVKKLEAKSVEVERITDALLGSVSETETSQGILAVLDHSPLPIPQSPDFVLILDQVRDPGNLGALLRTAAAAGVQAVLLPPETTDAFAPKAVRAGMGAHFRLPVHAAGWSEIRRICESAGLKALLADMDGESCWQTDLRVPLALVVGGEAEGASEQARSLAHDKISIPMPGGSESLNAAIAGAILLFEVVRQRTK